MDRIANQLGYRLQIDSVTVASPILAPNTALTVQISNTGSAPVYFPYQLAVDWVDDNEQTVTTWNMSGDLSQLMPGDDVNLSGAFGLPPNGTYSLRVKVRLASDAVRSITLANQSRDSQGRVIVGDVVVNMTDLIFMNGFEE